MGSRVIKVFYDNQGYPFKDSERVVRYPITGCGFTGSSNVNELHFYVRDCGGVNTLSWVANVKLPNGKILYQLLSNIYLDNELNEYYLKFDLSQFYTQLKGDIYISLNGCRGQVNITPILDDNDDPTGISELEGQIDTNTVMATGPVKFTFNYAVQRPQGVSFGLDQYQNIIDALAGKSNIITTIQIVADISQEDLSSYNDGQLLYDSATATYYEKVTVSDVATYVKTEDVGILGSRNTIVRFEVDSTTTFGRLWSLFGNRLVILDYGNDHLYSAKRNLDHTINVIAYDLIDQCFYVMNGANATDTLDDLINVSNMVEHLQKQSNTNTVYGINGSGEQVQIPYGVALSVNCLVMRDSDGQVLVPNTPTSDNHATSKKYVDNRIASIKQDAYQVVEELPSVGQEGVIYLLPIDESDLTKGYYRYIWENNDWLSLGTTEIDLSDYAKISYVDAQDNAVKEYANDNILTLSSSSGTLTQDQLTYLGKNNARIYYSATKRWYEKSHQIGTSQLFYKSTDVGVSDDGTKTTITLYWCVISLLNGNYGFASPDVELYNKNEMDTLLGAKASTTYVDGFGRSLDVSINTTNYVMTMALKDKNGNIISTQTVDLPLESVVVNGTYDSTTKSIILTLQSGSTITIPVGDLVDGLVSQASFNLLVTEVNKKANVDGNYPTLTAGLADNFTPYSEDSGAEQENPFISNGTGTNNNTEIVTVGDYALFKEKQGNTVVVNNHFQYGTFENTTGWQDSNATLTVSNNVGSFTPTAQYGGIYSYTPYNVINGHKYLTIATIKGARDTVSLNSNDMVSNNAVFISQFNSFQTIFKLWTAVNNNSITISVRDNGSSDFSEIQVKNVQLIDLTQMFDGDIPQDLLDHPEHFSWYYNGSLAYNTGTLENANGVKLVSTGRNLFNGLYSATDKYLDTSGNEISQDASGFNITEYIIVPSNKPIWVSRISGTVACLCFYDKDKNFISSVKWSDISSTKVITTPSNCVFVRNSITTSQVSNLVISLYYTSEQGGEGYDQYYPYKEPHIVDTGNEVLRQAGSAKDYKEPNGTIHRLVGNRAYQEGDENDNSLLTDGTTTNYPLENPTTEQGTPFPENLPINDYGMLYWLDSSNNLVGIPQGAKIFYPTNYKGFVDDLYSKVEGNSDDFALNSELNDKFETYLKSLSGYDATKTQTLKNVSGTLTWVDDTEEPVAEEVPNVQEGE